MALDLTYNPLLPELAAAYKQGHDAFVRYLRARAESQIVLNEAKLILVGEGGVGKSSLLGALRGDPWIDGRSTTHGVEIKPVKLQHDGKEITLNAWDFGGQPLYRTTHQLFFTAPAVYLTVWDPRRGPKQSAVDEWIKMIKHRAADKERPRILVVATCGGPKERTAHIDEVALRSQFGDLIAGFHHIDSFTGFHLDELKADIAATAAALPHAGRSVPATWKRVLDTLRDRSEPYLSYQQFEELCAGQNVNSELASTYAAILNELGYLIHYSADAFLKDTVILKADWLSKAISYVLEDRQVKEQNGLVEHERLTELWKEHYPLEIHPIFRRLMERFDLSYQIVQPDRKETSLIAQLVPGARPDALSDDWPAEPQPGDTERVQVCHIVDAETKQPAAADGLLYRLIVRLHRYSLGRNDYRLSRHWQRGMLLDDEYNGRALLEEIGGDVRVSVRAAYPERLLHQVCEEVKWLVDNYWKGLDCQITVPCTQPGCHGSLEIRLLIDAKRNNRPEFPCRACGTWLAVDALLATAATTPDLVRELRNVKDEIKQAVDTGYQSLSVQIRTYMSQADEQFAALMKTITDEGRDGPRLFSFVPVDPKFLDKPKWVAGKFRITLWCEHSRLPLPQLTGDPTSGVYEHLVQREWVVRASPFLKLLAGTLSLVLPVASSATKLLLDDAAYKRIEKDLDFGQKSVESVVKGVEKAGAWLADGESPALERTEAIRAEGGTLRELQSWLKEKDPSFGGLVRVQNKRREFLWVHPRFASEY